MFNGEIVFEIADDKNIEVDFGTEIAPTRIVSKDDIVALGRRAPKHRWVYEIQYDGESEYFDALEKMLVLLCQKKEYVNKLTKIYEEVGLNIYIRSDFAEIGCTLPNHILKKLSLLDCDLDFEILSFGLAATDVN